MTEMPAHSILVVDDDESFRIIMAQKLTRAGYTLTTAANGALAMQAILAGKTFDLILCDLKMPLQDGVDFLNALKTHKILTPVIMITGFPDREKIVAVAKSGVTEVLLKPFRGIDLLEKIRLKLA